jgi:hypothetical protein
MLDVGSIIATAVFSESVFFLEPSIFTQDPQLVHVESSALAFEDTTLEFTASLLKATQTGTPEFRPHLEMTATDYVDPVTTPANALVEQMSESNAQVTPAPSLPAVTIQTNVLEPESITSVVVGSQTLMPGGSTATIGSGASATLIHVDPNGEAVVVLGSSTSTAAPLITIGAAVATVLPSGSGLIIDSQTLTVGGSPITIDSDSGATTLSIDSFGHTIAVANGATSSFQAPATQALAIGDITATAVADSVQYVVGSSTLALDHPITIDGTVISLTTDSAGATILVADGSSSTIALAAPTEALGVSTTVIDGTTQYIVGSQTLAPGHPITVNGQALSITTSAGQTILVVGTLTTTISGAATTTRSDFAATSDFGDAAPGTLGQDTPSPTSTSSKKGAAERGTKIWSVVGVVAVAVLASVSGLG